MSKVDTLKLRLFELLVAYDIDNMTTQSKVRCWESVRLHFDKLGLGRVV